jgi:hypothetical protein
MIDRSVLLQQRPEVRYVARFLDSSHLRDDIKPIVQNFEDLAAATMEIIPSSPFLTVAMRKIVEAKDEAVRAYLHAREAGITHLTGETDGIPAPPNATQPPEYGGPRF